MAAHRLDQARAAHRGYFRWRRLSRVAIVAFGVFAVMFSLWALPWLPRGLNTDDYTPQLALSVYLMAGVAAAAVFALAFQELARRDRESLMVWGTVFDEVSGLHNRTYLYDRLSLECEKAARNGGVFSIVALQIRLGGSAPGSSPALPTSALQDIGTLLDCLTHPSDLVAILSGAELAVLAVGVDRNDRASLQERLRGAVAAGLPRLLKDPAPISVRCGGATYGEDSTDPGTLIQTARQAAILIPRGPAQAA
jgi:GGDEF domain-containing protein